MEWDQDICVQLINEYKNKEVLWNPRDPAYYNKVKKDDAWEELSEKFEKNCEELKKKINSLKGSYRREKARAKTRNARVGKGKKKKTFKGNKSFLKSIYTYLQDDVRFINQNGLLLKVYNFWKIKTNLARL